ncbi:MAG TPA: hypothetical protein VE264_02730 [Nitrososphaera sp.]|nr:hypothetical protein [Nitrososphaera sp.]
MKDFGKVEELSTDTRAQDVSISNNGGQSSNSDELKAQQRRMWDNAAAGWQVGRRPSNVQSRKSAIRLYS